MEELLKDILIWLYDYEGQLHYDDCHSGHPEGWCDCRATQTIHEFLIRSEELEDINVERKL